MTSDQLRSIVPQLDESKAASLVPGLNDVCHKYDISTPLRQAAFIAQVAHESGGFHFVREIWGPTAAQIRYEGRKDLGNTHPGDGHRFLGRGWIQLTGRANMTHYGKLLGFDLVNHPELAEGTAVAWLTAGAYWNEHGLNALADRGDLVAITRRINGGLNGYAVRHAYYRKALEVLGQAVAVTAVDHRDVGVFVGRKRIPQADVMGHIEDDGRSWVAVRVVAEALGWDIRAVDIPHHTVEVTRMDPRELVTFADFSIRGNTGFVPATQFRKLGVPVTWDADRREVSIG
jgi:putative chitinase